MYFPTPSKTSTTVTSFPLNLPGKIDPPYRKTDGTLIEKALADVNAVDDDGKAIIDDDGKQMVTLGLKSKAINAICNASVPFAQGMTFLTLLGLPVVGFG